MERTESTGTEQTAPVRPAGVSPTKTGSPRGSRLWKILAIVVVLLLLAACVGWKVMAHKRYDENKNINAGEYQALFLSNGQVYFGHLSDLNNKYVSMKDIYYLQVQQSQNLQQGTGTDANSQVSLAKLGSELHGPEDQMHIASDQVLFWENLKNDSKVTQAITKYQQSK
jgi:hypothetical protein